MADETAKLRPLSTESWPSDQKVERWQDSPVFVARFRDTGTYHGGLVERILELEQDPELTKTWDRGAGSAKVYNVDQWACAEADLVHARALAFFKKVFRTDEVFVDLSWATIYRNGDGCVPHSHLRTLASLVYFLDLGESDPENRLSGQFLFVDPRMKLCCQHEPGRMTTPGAPTLSEGTMIMFPGDAVHYVAPYTGTRPRITLSWNLNRSEIGGSPFYPVEKRETQR